MGKKIKLIQLGCGPFVNQTRWVDCDGSWNALINKFGLRLPKFIRFIYRLTGRQAKVFPVHVKYVNLHRHLPFPDKSLDGIYASHVWEHLYYKDGEFALKECFRVLKSGSHVRLVVPDLVSFCSDYLSSHDSDRAIILHHKLLYRHDCRERGWMLRLYNGLTDFHTHKFMYDQSAMISLMESVGFSGARECKYHESNIPFICDVELPGRIGMGVGFAIEARKD